MSSSLEARGADRSGYGYRSHFDDLETRDSAPVHESPVQARAATNFARTMMRVRKNPECAEAKKLFAEHPAIAAYERMSAQLKVDDKRNRSSAAWCGLIKHLGQLMGWPTTPEQWAEARARGHVMPQQREKGERARSNTDLGQRADSEIFETINHLVPPLASTVHRYTKWCFMYLYQRQWLPLEAQVPLWSADQTTVCTWADIICYDLTRPGRLVLIELKTGYTHHYTDVLTVVSGRMAHTAYNLHQMQLGWMQARLALVCKQYAGIEGVDGYVLRINSEEGIPKPFALDVYPREYFAGVYEQLNQPVLVPGGSVEVDRVSSEPAEIPNLLKMSEASRRRKANAEPKKRKRNKM